MYKNKLYNIIICFLIALSFLYAKNVCAEEIEEKKWSDVTETSESMKGWGYCEYESVITVPPLVGVGDAPDGLLPGVDVLFNETGFNKGYKIKVIIKFDISTSFGDEPKSYKTPIHYKITVGYPNKFVSYRISIKYGDTDGNGVYKPTSLFVLDDRKIDGNQRWAMACPADFYLNILSMDAYDGIVPGSITFETSNSTDINKKISIYKPIIGEPTYIAYGHLARLVKTVSGPRSDGRTDRRWVYGYHTKPFQYKFGTTIIGCNLDDGEDDKKIDKFNRDSKELEEKVGDKDTVNKDLAKKISDLATSWDTYYSDLKDKNYCRYLREDFSQLLDKINTRISNLSGKALESGELDATQTQNLEQVVQRLQEYEQEFDSILSNPEDFFSDIDLSCNRIINDDLKAVIQTVLLWTRILIPILLIILVAVDFSQAVISQDQDAIKKAISKTIKRSIAALAVFFIPFLVSLMLNWVEDSDYFNRSNADCEVIFNE